MKRKKDFEDEDNKRPKLSLLPIVSLPCEICNTPVYEYRSCISPYVYCSLDCFEIIFLMYYGKFKDVSFDDDLQE
jgi:hypothetical protein